MSTTGLAVFDSTIQKTRIWLNDVMRELGWTEREKAYLALRTTLHALRDRLSVQEVIQLGAQLPLLLAGVYYSGWNPSDKLEKRHHKEDFFERIRHAFRDDFGVTGEKIARAVFIVMEEHVSKGELDDVKAILPAEIREFWNHSISVPEHLVK